MSHILVHNQSKRVYSVVPLHPKIRNYSTIQFETEKFGWLKGKVLFTGSEAECHAKRGELAREANFEFGLQSDLEDADHSEACTTRKPDKRISQISIQSIGAKPKDDILDGYFGGEVEEFEAAASFRPPRAMITKTISKELISYEAHSQRDPGFEDQVVDTLGSMQRQINEISSKLDDLKTYQARGGASAALTEVIHNGENLLDIHASQWNKYVTAVMSVLFTDEEMKRGLIIEGPNTSDRTPLDPERVEKLKLAVQNKYPKPTTSRHKQWLEAKVTANRKCRDTERKLKKSVNEGKEN